MKNLLKQQSKVTPYKPFMYPEAYARYELHEKARWNKDEVSLASDIRDWASLSDAEREFLKYTFLLFTQNDVSVGAGYDVLLRCFKPTEIQMMLRNQADRENIHIDAYSYLLDTLGFPESIYQNFKEINVMSDKLEYVEGAKIKDNYDNHSQYVRDLAYMLAVYTGCTEGVSLFAQFALLLSYSLKGLMAGMCQIVTWSIRDEEQHIQNNSWLFKQLIKENRSVWDDELKHKIYSAFREIVTKEKAYLDYLYDRGVTPMITKEQMYSYLEYIADRRLKMLGLKANYGVKTNPLPFMEELLDSPEFANFFVTQSTEYGRSSTTGSWDDIR